MTQGPKGGADDVQDQAPVPPNDAGAELRPDAEAYDSLADTVRVALEHASDPDTSATAAIPGQAHTSMATVSSSLLKTDDAHNSDDENEYAATPGEVIAGRYRIGPLLGVGGMGQVYRAKQLGRNRVVGEQDSTETVEAQRSTG